MSNDNPEYRNIMLKLKLFFFENEYRNYVETEVIFFLKNAAVPRYMYCITQTVIWINVEYEFDTSAEKIIT